MFSKSNSCSYFEKSPLLTSSVVSVIFIRYLVLILSTVYNYFVSQHNGLVKSQHFWGIFIIHVFLSLTHGFEIELVENVLKRIATHSSYYEQLVSDQIH